MPNSVYWAATYGAGPSKLAEHDPREIIETADVMRAHAIKYGMWIHQSLRAIERALQMRIDEEGCGAVFAAVKFGTHQHTLSVDTEEPRHGDVNGDAASDTVTCQAQCNKGCGGCATDLGSGAEKRAGSSPVTRTTPKSLMSGLYSPADGSAL